MCPCSIVGMRLGNIVENEAISGKTHSGLTIQLRPGRLTERCWLEASSVAARSAFHCPQEMR